MARGRVLAAVVVSGAAVAGAVLWRRRGRRQERVDLYYADGSMVSLDQGSDQANRLVPLAREVVAASRGTAAAV